MTKLKWLIISSFTFVFLLITIGNLYNFYYPVEIKNLSDLGVEKFEKATKIRIQYITDLSQQDIIINDPEKIKLTLEFLKQHPNDWRKPQVTARVFASIFIIFLDGDKVLGSYGINPNYLTYNITHLRYFKYGENPQKLFKDLDISSSKDFN